MPVGRRSIDRKEIKMMTAPEKFERAVFLLCLIVVACNLYWP